LPIRVIDGRVDRTYDVYENQLVNSFYLSVARRLARLDRSLTQHASQPNPKNAMPQQDSLKLEISQLQKRLSRARSQAEFLNGVSPLKRPPDHVSMVLLNRSPYRAALERYYEFLRSVWVRLEEPALEAPLQNFPYLYEIWGTLRVLSAPVTIAGEMGFIHVDVQRLAERDSDGVFLRLVPNGQPAVVLRHPTCGTEVRVIPQRSYAASGQMRSISFMHVPDVTVEVRAPGGAPHLYLFDPKYKLDSQQSDTFETVGPTKEDIDKMHAYRDAIRGANDARVVKYAAILYPGPSVTFPRLDVGVGEVAALCADPERPELLSEMLRPVLSAALARGCDG
jgi:predicted component of viral defense system (DUF524 family)